MVDWLVGWIGAIGPRNSDVMKVSRSHYQSHHNNNTSSSASSNSNNTSSSKNSNRPKNVCGAEREPSHNTDRYHQNHASNDIQMLLPLSIVTPPPPPQHQQQQQQPQPQPRPDHSSPRSASHQQRLKRKITKYGIMTGLSFATSFAFLCIYYYHGTTTNRKPLIPNQEKRRIYNDDEPDPILSQFFVPSTDSSRSSSSSSSSSSGMMLKMMMMPSDDEMEMIHPADERQTTGGTFNSILTAMGWTNVDGDQRSWDFDGPPIQRTAADAGGTVRPPLDERSRMTTVTDNSRSTGNRYTVLDETSTTDSEATMAPTSHDDGGSTGKTAGYSDMLFPNNQIHADAALKCSESVKNFVVNATDGKDECDGLIKAYGKTCSDNNAHDEDTTTTIPTRRYLNEHTRKRRRRKLWDKLNSPITLRWRAYLYQTAHAIKRQCRKWLVAIGYIDYDINSVFFFAEDEILKAWDDSQQIVDHQIHEMVQSNARRFMNEGQCAVDLMEEQHRRLQSGVTETDRHTEPLLEKHETTTTTGTTSLQLPIKHQEHVSEKDANHALILQEGNGLILKAANETTVLTTTTLPDEADISKQAVSDTGNAVSAVLNDPTSKEAITCCTSILSVYHDLCSTDVEEQVSDARLFFLVFVLACCGMVKSLIRHYKMLWLPEAAGCILVGGTYRYILATVLFSDTYWHLIIGRYLTIPLQFLT